MLTPVPWEVTTSYGSGTSRGPQAILDASPQIDLYDLECGDAYKEGYYLEDEAPQIRKANGTLKALAQKIIKEWDDYGKLRAPAQKLLQKVNNGCAWLSDLVEDQTNQVLKENKIPGLIGGDHSSVLGALRAIGNSLQGDFGVLHIDAHADLRLAYQGFEHSHASIMRNVCQLKNAPSRLVQVAIRDFCEEEMNFIRSQKGRIFTHFDNALKEELFKGKSWQALCEKIIEPLPKNVYISFDIDGLSPEFCPHTGTPVPGGLSFDQATHLLKVLAQSGCRIVGFDLNEVAPGKDSEWDANVGARILFKLCGWAVRTNQRT